MDRLTVAIKWLQVLQQLLTRGTEAWSDLLRVLSDHNIEFDNAALDAAIAEAEQAKLDAIRESVLHGGQS
jgi:hypothetical protein